jgi:hypothetical protein
MFSSTFKAGNRFVIWNERPIPAARIASGASPATERPSRLTVPPSGL